MISFRAGNVLHKREYAAGGAWKIPRRNPLLDTRRTP